ncbi:hypothetical protein LSUB1_G008221 [Lachnellula subtilissima]|uniref:Uncharacterized protein n=1 Tax=Lachnellula subtilissima TaxID=602034 RepID=A0A8H8RDP0_9HELO|nr:hypothetical protein LSUB1_G008221 [Lachnellula subtilissima]
MDTALTTFMTQTSPSTHSVHLIGSWDNFSKHYPMERDTRRSRGQWRGCYAFTDIICDGDGDSSPKRTGGLKMGSTYYYYYELDDGTEHYDPSLPSTTSCPYLPGQPVNLLSVPVEIQPLRYRSASMTSMANSDIKTMNPADKFMAPRPPPPTPTILPRLNTSPSLVAKKRNARSVSPPSKPERSPWSPKALFGLRSPAVSSFQDNDKRGRSTSTTNTVEGSSSASNTSLINLSERKATSVPQTRDTSPQAKISLSREPSPLRQLATHESSTYHSTTLVIPDEIVEEAEDDDNFASQLNRISLNNRGIFTQLSPAPSRMRSQSPQVRTATNTSKPLPLLPEETLVPPPLRLRAAISAAELPRSHFSVSTVSTTISSPADSHFDFSETPSISDSCDDDEFSVDIGSENEFTYSPVIDETLLSGFSGYSLPDDQYASEHTLRKEATTSSLAKSAARSTFGGASAFPAPDSENMSALEELMNDMGYLGGVIVARD